MDKIKRNKRRELEREREPHHHCPTRHAVQYRERQKEKNGQDSEKRKVLKKLRFRDGQNKEASE